MAAVTSRCIKKACACNKVSFRSVRHARWALKSAGYRIRVYPCPDGRGYHVTRSRP